ncbi:MAG: phosphoribosylanthranilate isomerase [Thermoproteota archaeon]
MVKVKICGITRMEDLEDAMSAGADIVGFIIDVPSSPRSLRRRDAAHLISMVPSSVSSVAVTVLRDLEGLKRVLDLGADYLQLHGEPSLLVNLAKEGFLRGSVIGVVNARFSNALELAVEYSGLFEIVLLDSLRNGCLGGSGEAHDWRVSRMIRDAIQPKPLILAGGLTPDNVGIAVSTVKPYGVDVSTGVETKPGVKDREKVFRFVSEAKKVEA